MFTSEEVSGSDIPLITVSWQERLAAINALDIINGGLGAVAISSGSVTCAVDDTSNPAFPDLAPEDRLVGPAILRSPYLSQFFSSGVEGADYIMTFQVILSNGESISAQVRIRVRKYT